ncbi:hypothetical protein AB4144_52690, partial [Rhizobiaceae sp. 2RAB30]
MPGRREVGRPHPTHDIDAIVTGSRAVYSDDIRLPNMLFGAVIRPASLEGHIVSIDASACKSVPGFLGLYREGDFAGFVAARRGALAQAMDLLVVEETRPPAIDTAAIAAMVESGAPSGSLEHTVLDAGESSDR